MRHVFISYSHEDRTYAQQLVQGLQDVGFETWIAEQRIDYGDEWWEVIEQAIQNCAAIIPLMSPKAKESRWVKRETMLADELGKPVFPLLLEGERWGLYVTTQYADVRDGLLPGADFYGRLSKVAARTHMPEPPLEDAPRKSEEIYRNIVERANDGIMIVQHGMVKYVNAPLARMMGYTVTELTEVTFLSFIAEAKRETVISYYDNRVSGMTAPTRYETQLEHADGHAIDVEFNSGLMFYDKEPAVVVIIRDITARKQAEA